MRIQLTTISLLAGALVVFGVSYALTQSNHQDGAPYSRAIRGRVVDINGQPVSEATVHALKSELTIGRLPTAYTDQQGMFLIEGLTTGTYTVSAAKEEDGYPPTDSPFYSVGLVEAPQITVHEQEITPEVVIQLGPKAAKLVGRIIDATTRKPVNHVQMTLSRFDYPNYQYSTSPDLKGDFELLVPSLPVNIQVSAPGYKNWYYGGDGSKGQANAMHLKPNTTRELVISLWPKLNK
jgi:hypothetical protein